MILLLALLQLCFDFIRNEGIKFMERCQTNFTRLQGTNMCTTSEGAIYNRLDRGHDTHLQAFWCDDYLQLAIFH